jgi:N-acetylmuramoyl-L-alanine amidase
MEQSMSKFLKKNIALFCTVCLLVVTLSSFASAEEDEEVYIDSGGVEVLSGTAVTMTGEDTEELPAVDVPLYSGETLLCVGYKDETGTYVPVRKFCSAVDPSAVIGWDQEVCAVIVNADGMEISFGLNDHFLTANGRCLYLENGVTNKDGTVYAPLDELAECFGISLKMDEQTSHVEIVPGEPQYIETAATYYDEESLYWLSHIINAEAGNQSLEGMIGVGNVVLNRVKDPSCPDTVYDVIFDNRYGVQFSPTVNGTIYDEPNELSVVAAKICMEGYELVGSSLFFVNPEIGISSWFASTRTYVATIGDHAFYA